MFRTRTEPPMLTTKSPNCFFRFYISLSRLAKNNHDSLWVYMKLLSVTDGTKQRLVRSKMLTLFKPILGQVFSHNVSGFNQEALGSPKTVTFSAGWD